MNPTFIVTKEHRRFTEFANAVRKERTIGICHGDAGVGKTLSARRYANWDDLEPYFTEWGPRGDQDRSRTVFYTPDVLCRPKALMDDIHRYQVRIGSCVDEHLHKLDAAPRSMNKVTKLVELLIIDEAERLNATALELLRDNHDRTHMPMVLIGMPGIDQRFRHYPQLYSRWPASKHDLIKDGGRQAVAQPGKDSEGDSSNFSVSVSSLTRALSRNDVPKVANAAA